MVVVIALLNAAPFQMALFKEAHPNVIHVPIFVCDGEVWPAPAPGWAVRKRDGDWIAEMTLPED